jgi:LmbE family N-acetylglucosaminyl deacetylase
MYAFRLIVAVRFQNFTSRTPFPKQVPLAGKLASCYLFNSHKLEFISKLPAQSDPLRFQLHAANFLEATERLAIIAPHPDDETLGCGGLIWEARQRSIPVSIIFLTNGDGNRVGTSLAYRRLRPSSTQYREYGQDRQAESLRAIRELGVQPSSAFFLGLPDQGLTRIARTGGLVRSRYTAASASPYLKTLATPYSHTAVLQRLSHLLEELRPTVLLLPLLEDSHKDHRAAGNLAYTAARELSLTPRLFGYPIHYRFFPKPGGVNTELPLLPPRWHERHADFLELPLSNEAVAAKSAAVETYESQLEIPLLGKLMRSLVRHNELLLPLEP